MKKIEVQQRVLQNGKPLDLDKFGWDKKTNTFSSSENLLVIDFSNLSVNIATGDYSTVKTGDYSIITTGDSSTVTTGYGSTVKTGWNSSVTTSSVSTVKTGSGCAIVNRNMFEVIQLKKGGLIQICPYNIAGHLVNGLYNGEPHIIADGILSKIVSQKGNIYKVINHGESKQSYLIKQGDTYSHGKTLKEARESLIYKISDRDTTAYKSMTVDTVLSKEDCIKMYITITGACASGTKYFVDSQEDVRKEYSIKEIIELTKGQFGNESLREFFNN